MSWYSEKWEERYPGGDGGEGKKSVPFDPEKVKERDNLNKRIRKFTTSDHGLFSGHGNYLAGCGCGKKESTKFFWCDVQKNGSWIDKLVPVSPGFASEEEAVKWKEK